MPFPFTFIFNVPGIINPFSPNVGALSQPRRSHLDRPPPSPSPTPTPLSRKRGWQPSLAEPSRSTTTLTATTGYLDTQSLVMGSALSGTSNPHLPSNDQYDEGEHSSSPASCWPRSLQVAVHTRVWHSFLTRAGHNKKIAGFIPSFAFHIDLFTVR